MSYPETASTTSAGLTTVKTHWNSAILNNSDKHCTICIKGFYLNLRLEEHAQMRIQLNILPEEIILLCNLREIADKDGFVCIEIKGGKCGLPHARSSSFNDIVKNLAPYGHAPAQCTLGPWTKKIKI